MNGEEFAEELYRENLYFVYEDKCKELEKEIKKLKEDNEYLNKVNIELSTEKNRLNNIINKLEAYCDTELNKLAVGTSHTYEDSLGKTRLVNEDIYKEIGKIKYILQELKGSDKEWKSII